MTIKAKVMFLSLIAGIVFWIFGFLMDYFFLNTGSLKEMLIMDISSHKIYIRTGTALMFIVLGVLISRIINGYLANISKDITERKKSEEKTVKSLKEKEVLLKEIHHRVKNNLQIIISLLNLQSSKIKDSQALKVFSECTNRILSMALVHEKLYQSKNFSNIKFKEYVETMTTELFGAYDVKENISLDIRIEDIEMNMEKAVPCGLILNELVSNACEHAFPDDKPGYIQISFRSVHNKLYELSVKDNGVGIPQNIDPGKTQSLGLKLVNILADQLGGTASVKRERGTLVSITFPSLDYYLA